MYRIFYHHIVRSKTCCVVVVVLQLCPRIALYLRSEKNFLLCVNKTCTLGQQTNSLSKILSSKLLIIFSLPLRAAFCLLGPFVTCFFLLLIFLLRKTKTLTEKRVVALQLINKHLHLKWIMSPLKQNSRILRDGKGVQNHTKRK